MRKIFHFFCLFFLSYSMVGQGENPLQLGSPFITNYLDVEFQERGRNYGILQGEDGRMYFANNYGLLSFNGYRWELIAQPNNVSEIRSFAIIGEKIFIGGVAEIGVVSPTSNGTANYQSLNHLIADQTFHFNDVREISTLDDQVFFLTDNGLMLLSEDSIQVFAQGIAFRASAKGIQELIFVANDSGIFKFENNELKEVSVNDVFRGLSMEFVLPIEDEAYLIGTDSEGVLLFKDGEIRQWNENNRDLFIKNHLVHATILNKQELVFGSIHDGLIVTNYEGEILNIINEKDGLLDHNILSIYKDQKGNIWTAVDGSFAYIELNSPFTIFNKKNGLRGEIYDILHHNEKLYIATSRGLYIANFKADGSVTSEFKLIENTTGQCWDLFEHQGVILLGHHKGIFIVENTKATFLGDGGNWNFSTIPGFDNLLLSGNYRGISLLKKINGQYQIQYLIDGFEETARELMIDNDLNIWVSQGYQGIYKLKLSEDFKSFDSLNLYNTDDGLPTDLFNNLIRIDQEIVFGTQNGVYQYNSELNRMEVNPLFSTILGKETLIRKLWQTPNDNYLCIKNYARTDEIQLIEVLEDGSYSIKLTPFQKLKGQLIPAFEPIFFPDDHKIFFGSKQGLIIFDAEFREDIPTQHNCFINQVSLPLRDSLIFQGSGQLTFDLEQVIDISASDILRFNFYSSYIEPHSFTYYSSYLEGFDQEWQDWTTNNNRDFINLPDGQYTFRVKSQNIFDVESTTATFIFEVRNEQILFSQSTLFLSLFTLFVISLISYFFFKRRTKKLSANIKSLDSALNESNQKVKETTDQLIENKTAKKELDQKLSSAILKNEIYGGLMEKLNSLNKNSVEKKELDKLISNFQDDLKEIEIQLTAQQTLETNDFLSRIKSSYPDLSARELRLCSYLKLNISSKELANYLGISIRGVESLRYRVRKKMGLRKEQDLTEFILNL